MTAATEEKPRMKKLLLFCLLAISICLIPWVSPARSHDDENKVFSKRRDLPLLASAASSAKTVGKAEWNEALEVLAHEGRWLKVGGKDGEGWVYSGNVATEKLPDENKNDMPMKASGLTATVAARGLSGGADAYAGRHSLGEVAEQLRWAEKFSASITMEEARAYLKANKLGEFAEVK